MTILEPFQKDATTIRADDLRNLLDRLRHRARAPAHARNHRHVRRQLAGRHVGGPVHAADCRRQDRRRRARQGDGTGGQKPLGGHPAHHPDRADERAAGRHAAAGVPRGSEEVDRPAGQGGCRRRCPLLRLPGAEQPRRAHRPAAAAGVHRPHDPADDGRPADLAPGTPAGTIVSPPSYQAQPSSASGSAQPQTTIVQQQGTQPPGRPVAQAVARAWAIPGRARRQRRRRAQRPGRRRQGQQHRPDRRHAGRIRGDRSGAEKARRAATPGPDPADHRRGDADRRPDVRHRLAVSRRSTVGARQRRQLQFHQDPVQSATNADRYRHNDRGECRLPGIAIGVQLHDQQRHVSRRGAGRCTCSTATAARASSPIRTWLRSTTRKRRSRSATGSRSTSRPSSAARPARSTTP